MGNIFTHYNYITTDIHFSRNAEKITIRSKKSDLDIEVNINKEKVSLPDRSPFMDWKEARQYAGPLPFTFTYNSIAKEVLIIEGVRESWKPMPAEVVKSRIGFIENKKFNDCLLANAFIIENIPYYWKKGRIELWKNPSENLFRV